MLLVHGVITLFYFLLRKDFKEDMNQIQILNNLKEEFFTLDILANVINHLAM